MLEMGSFMPKDVLVFFHVCGLVFVPCFLEVVIFLVSYFCLVIFSVLAVK